MGEESHLLGSCPEHLESQQIGSKSSFSQFEMVKLIKNLCAEVNLQQTPLSASQQHFCRDSHVDVMIGLQSRVQHQEQHIERFKNRHVTGNIPCCCCNFLCQLLDRKRC